MNLNRPTGNFKLALLSLFFCITTALLCSWQIKRLKWKEDIIQMITDHSKITISSENEPLIPFAKVSFNGAWGADLIFLEYKIRNQKMGCEVAKPFKTKGGKVFWVNLGWQESCSKNTFPLKNRVQGILREMMVRADGTPENTSDHWYYLNLEQLKETERFYIDTNPEIRLPTNNHKIYAITWGGLATLFLGYFIYLLF